MGRRWLVTPLVMGYKLVTGAVGRRMGFMIRVTIYAIAKLKSLYFYYSEMMRPSILNIRRLIKTNFRRASSFVMFSLS